MHDIKEPSKLRILVIEDDRFIGEMYTHSLQSAGFQVDWFADGNNGLSAAKTNSYDVILLDIMLPEKMGTEILKELRSGQYKIKSRIIVTTNFEQDEDSRAAMESQVDAYLIKADTTPRKLLEIVNQLTP